MNKFTTYIFIAIACLLCLPACNRTTKVKETIGSSQYQKISQLHIKYAKGFSVEHYKGFTVASVKDLNDSSKIIARYLLIPKGDSIPPGFNDAVVIETPVQKVVCISTTHIAEMDRLGLTDSIAAVTNVPLIYNKEVIERVKQKAIANIGNQELNYEKLVELHPSFVTTSGSYDGGDKMKQKLNTLHVKQVLNLEYKEQDPLARAEWVKFIAIFYNCEIKADSIFNEIEKNYLQLKQQAKAVDTHPSVLSNLPFKEIWYMPTGENYMAKLITDAGGYFLWKDAKQNNGLNLNLDYEAVYNKAANADLWLNTGFATSLAEIKGADKKNAFFKAFKTGEVYNNNLRNTQAGGFDFWESGVVNPDKILADLIFILHPNLLKGHQLYYYQKLK